MCRAFPVPTAIRAAYALDLRRIQAHHILPQHKLKQHNQHDHLWDERNGLGLCAYHHPRHTNWRQRVPRELIPAAAYEFAEEVKLAWLLDLEYPLP